MRRFCLILFCSLLSGVAFAQLKSRELCVEYAVSDDVYWATARRAGKEPRSVRLGSAREIDSLCSLPDRYEEENARTLYERLLKPLHPRRKETIFFVPAGKLHFINLAALSNRRGRRCFRSYHLYRISSTDSLPRETVSKNSLMPLGLYGGIDYFADPDEMIYRGGYCHRPPLEGLFPDEGGVIPTLESPAALRSSRDEIKFIFQLGRFGTMVHTGAGAMEEVFRMDTRRKHPYMLHLSTHSFYVPSEPLTGILAVFNEWQVFHGCGLLFAGAGRTLQGKAPPYGLNDGLLFASEIASLDMRWCELMVLGACDTMQGHLSEDGVTGLRSAFKKAGVKTLLMTIGSVNDRATSAFMQYFYKHLREERRTKHESLDLARRDMMKDPDFSDPVYWAPFIMLD